MRKKGVVKVNAIVYWTNQKSINFFTKNGYRLQDEDLIFGKPLDNNAYQERKKQNAQD